MKNILILIFFFLNLFTIEARSEMLVLDRLENPGQTTQGQRWSFFTDGVMGGVSEGTVKLDKINNIFCYRMIGNVTTENNGGFIQIRSLLKPNINGSDYEGIYFKVFGSQTFGKYPSFCVPFSAHCNLIHEQILRARASYMPFSGLPSSSASVE